MPVAPEDVAYTAWGHYLGVTASEPQTNSLDHQVAATPVVDSLRRRRQLLQYSKANHSVHGWNSALSTQLAGESGSNRYGSGRYVAARADAPCVLVLVRVVRAHGVPYLRGAGVLAFRARGSHVHGRGSVVGRGVALPGQCRVVSGLHHAKVVRVDRMERVDVVRRGLGLSLPDRGENVRKVDRGGTGLENKLSQYSFIRVTI